MSKPSFRTSHLLGITLILGLWAVWNGPKDWLGPLDRNHAKVLNAVQSDRLNARPIIRHNLGNITHKEVPQVSESYGKLPLSFEVNQGQADPQVKFLSRGQGYRLFLTATEAILQLPVSDRRWPNDETSFDYQPSTSEILSLPFMTPYSQSTLRHSPLATRHLGIFNRKLEISNRQSSSLQIKLIGADPNSMAIGLNELPGKSNYLLGNDPGKWRTNVPNYSKVRYREVYPGIDLVYYGNPQELEHDFVVAPGADPGKIHLVFQGADVLGIDSAGDLVMQVAGREVRQRSPRVYQQYDDSRVELGARYVLEEQNQVAFVVAPYDPTCPLVIDPVTVFATYLGGSGPDTGFGIAVDSKGCIVVVGRSDSADFPTSGGTVQSNFGGGGMDAFVTKLDSEGKRVVFSSYLGGSAKDYAWGVAIDSGDNIYLAGATTSSNFPTRNPLQLSFGGRDDAFVAKLSPDGSTLAYSTYLGRNGTEQAFAIAVDNSGSAFVTGYTTSSNFPTVNPLQANLKGSADGIVAKLSPDGARLVYSTFLGGSQGNEWGSAIAVDGDGNAYVTGRTDSTDFPTVKSIQSRPGGSVDAFVAKFNPNGSALEYSTYYGGSDFDQGIDIDVDVGGSAFVVGEFQGFLAVKLDPAGSQLTYAVPPEIEGRVISGYAICLDRDGNAYIGGQIGSVLGGSDALVAKISASGTAEIVSIIGGNGGESAYAIATDQLGNVYLAGWTDSTDFATPNVVQTQRRGPSDAFVVKIPPGSPAGAEALFVPIVLSSAGMNNSFFTSEIMLTNKGKQDAILELSYTAAFGGGSGIGTDVVMAGQTKLFPDAIDYLRISGVPLPDSDGRGGTLRVKFSGVESSQDLAITVRTTTVVPEGRAGLAYSGVPQSAAFTGTVYLCGLRQNATDRSNVAVQNAGTPEEGDIVLRLTVFSADPSVNPQVPPDITLSPGGFTQISGILGTYGFPSGYVKVERISGDAPYYAYAVVNDQGNSDGSFVLPLSADSLNGASGLTLPVVVDTSAFNSELVLTNFAAIAKTLQLAFVADNIQSADSTARFSLSLNAGQQMILPNLVQWLRTQGTGGIGPAGPTYAGALFASVEAGDCSGIFMGARTATPGGGGYYGLFYTAVPFGQASTTDAWLYGLQQNTENRTNLALVNTGEAGGDPDIFNIEIYDGSTGQLASTVKEVTLPARHWRQINMILGQYAPQVTQGYAHVIRTSGNNPFIAYAVINDGGQAGQRSGDGAFIASMP